VARKAHSPAGTGGLCERDICRTVSPYRHWVWDEPVTFECPDPQAKRVKGRRLSLQPT